MAVANVIKLASQPEIQRLTLHPAQVRIRAEAKRFNVASCGRRIGKTILAIDLLKETVLAGYPAAYFAPTYKMLTESWESLVSAFKPMTKTKSVQEKRIDLTTGGIIECWSLDTDMVARSRKYKRAVVDEAAHVSGLKKSWQAAIRPTLTDLKGDGWFFSTPNGMNDFWQFYQLGLDPLETEWACWQMPTTANPYIDPNEIEAARKELPQDIFAQEYLAEFIADSGAVFRDILAAAIAVAQERASLTHVYVVGCDWAKYQDFSVFTVIDTTTREVCFLARYNRLEYEYQMERLTKLCELFCPVAVLSEVTGNIALAEQLRHISYYDRLQGKVTGLPVRDFSTTNASKAEIIQALALAFEHHEVKIPNDPILVGELQAFTAVRTDAGNLRYTAPEGFHDDCVMSLALAWNEARRYPAIENLSADMRLERQMKEMGWLSPETAAIGDKNDPMWWFSRELNEARLKNRVNLENKYGAGQWDAAEEAQERREMLDLNPDSGPVW